MIEVWISVPRRIDIAEVLLPVNHYPHGATPHWAPREYIAEFPDLDKAEEFAERSRRIEGVHARIRGPR